MDQAQTTASNEICIRAHGRPFTMRIGAGLPPASKNRSPAKSGNSKVKP